MFFILPIHKTQSSEQYNSFLKNKNQQLEHSDIVLMKTKTGQFLMMQSKSKQIPRQNSEQPNKQQKTLVTPSKPINNLSDMISPQDIKNKQPHEKLSQEKTIYQNQLITLRQENRKLWEQIQYLRRQSKQLRQSLSSTQKKYQLKQQQSQKNKQLKEPFRLDFSQNMKRVQKSVETESKIHVKLQSKISLLEVQNYRLIENNYLLILKLKKNMKNFKEFLLKIVNMLENLQFSQASKEIYDMLASIRKQDGNTDGFQSQMFPSSHLNMMRQQKSLSTTSTQTTLNLALKPRVYDFEHIPESLQQRQNSIQMNIRNLHNLTRDSRPIEKLSSSSFNMIPHNKYKSNSEFQINKKLFGSEIDEVEFQPHSLVERGSINEKFQSQWDNNYKTTASNNKQLTIYKCHGNSTEIYKMLVLQASAIEGFF